MPIASSISKGVFTWYFNADHEVGYFVDGQPWVVGPATLTAIFPEPSVGVDGLARNGAMLNVIPDVASPYNYGFDGRTIYGQAIYRSSLNAALALPRTLLPGDSWISSQSKGTITGAGPQLETGAVLTVLSVPAPEGSFRPYYYGGSSSTKTILANVSDISLARFQNLPRVPSAPADMAAWIPDYYSGLYIDLFAVYLNSQMGFADAGPKYGRDVNDVAGRAALMLNLDYPEADKRALLIPLIQRGIDVYGGLMTGNIWGANGGHHSGRKTYLALAAAAIGHVAPDLMAKVDGTAYNRFQEDRQTTYVLQADIDNPRSTPTNPPYTQDMLGMPEWMSNAAWDGIKPYASSERDQTSPTWDKPYRRVNGPNYVPVALAMRLMGMREAWNWPAFFDYCDRHWNVDKNFTGNGSFITFTKEMMNAYRGLTELPSDPDPLPYTGPLRSAAAPMYAINV